jgi:hypothetical protein
VVICWSPGTNIIPPLSSGYDPVDVVRPDGHVELTVPGTELDDGIDHLKSWLNQHGWAAW